MTNDAVKRGYNKAAENYAAGRGQFENSKYLEKLHNLLSPHSTILDIGCGAGKPVDSFFVSKGHKIIGIDISEKMVELAKQNVPEGDFEVEDMSNLKEGQYKVDAVVSFYAIFHTSREIHGEILKKINSFLQKGGKILITMGSNEWEGEEEDFYGTKMFWSHFGPEENTKLVKEAGFTVLLNEIDGNDKEKHQVILAEKA